MFETPWIAVPSGDGDGMWLVIDPSGNAVCFGIDEKTARVISAAPELVKHGKRVMDLLEVHGGKVVPHLLDNDDNPGEYLRDAIAKAGA